MLILSSGPVALAATDVGEDFCVIDIPINKVFNTNVKLPDLSNTIRDSSSDDIYALYDELMAQHPTYITKTLLGTESSPDALPIYKYEFKPIRPSTSIETKQAKYLIASGTHPEKMGVWALYKTMENICNNWREDELLEALRFNVCFIIIPVVSPWSYDYNSRTNYNGVDIARNFSAGWKESKFGSNTYGGPSPFSENEAKLVYQMMLENPDLLGVIDFHNFFGSKDNYIFLWGVCANQYTRNICMSLIQRMDRKWKREYPFINQDMDCFIGNTEGIASGGSMAAQAHEMGFKGALTFEVCERVSADKSGSKHDSNALTMAYEAFINFLLMLTIEFTKN